MIIGMSLFHVNGIKGRCKFDDYVNEWNIIGINGNILMILEL